MKLIRWMTLLLFLMVLTPPAEGWGRKGHHLANEAATAGLPADLPQFFHDSYPQLVYLGYDPDRWRSGGPSLTSLNSPDHFLDYEYVEHLELPVQRYEFLELLHESRTLDKWGIRPTTPGFAPWKIAELAELIENQWRIWLEDDLNPAEQYQVEQTIIHYAGVLGHYVSDVANPHHASIHYNGWVGVPNENDYPTDCETHWRFETQFVARAVTREEVFAAIEPLQLRSRYFEEAIGFVRESQSLIDEIYRMDRDGAFTGADNEEGHEFAVARLARGASWLRDLWVSTWRAAHEEK